MSSSFLQIYQTADDQAHDAAAQDPFPAYVEGIEDNNLAPFCPTSATRVLKALSMGKVSSQDRLVDLGSGDGRFVTAAASEYRCQALGIETDEELISQSRRLADQVFGGDHTQHGVKFEHGDLLTTLKKATSDTKEKELPWTVIVLFLLPDHSDRFADDLVALHNRGARIISLVFNLNEIKGLTLQQADDQDGIYVYGKNSLL
ncbi:uncharacterized protein BX664DRAFT_318745 [Halteromyces radiatus]|uniref:uncharacterized protein n=1 Tax=Halteromyces radiatus TaxID=101107 RepID=UPI00221EE3D6|nr:uncharacterized protein BX664DRAFT_318745 [Halteromyces radiatus]KAI8098453.1 hypothetical protein BX664DRAFT_318745 [Halteromyces radiatus]